MRGRATTLAAAAALAGLGGFALAGPAADECVAQASTTADVEPRIDCGTAGGGAGTSSNAPGTGPGPGGNRPGTTPGPAENCTAAGLFRTVSARSTGGRLRLSFTRRSGATGRVRVDLFQTTRAARVIGNRRVARLTRSGTVGRGLPDGIFFARFSLSSGGRTDVRRIALRRRDGRFARRPDFYRRDSCGTLSSFKLESPAFGGRTNRALGIAYRLTRAGRTTVTVTRGSRTVRRFPATADRADRTYRLRLRSEQLRRGDYRVTLRTAPSGGGAPVTARLVSVRR